MKETFDQAIKRLIQMKNNGELKETDIDEVAEKFNTTREEVIACCITY